MIFHQFWGFIGAIIPQKRVIKQLSFSAFF